MFRVCVSRWNTSARLNEQLEALRPAILSPTADVDYSVAFVGHNFSHTPIRTLLKASPTGLVLLAVNLDASGPLLVRFSFAHGVLGANVSALFEPGAHGRLLTTFFAGLRLHTGGAVLQGSRR